MSLCSSTVRAWSRSRAPASKTLLPFLYHTRTIQQCRPATVSIARRNISSPSNEGGDDIPFDDGSLPPSIDEPQTARKTTMTGSERAAFEKLYKKFNTQGRPNNEKDHVVELDQIADEYYEDEEENEAASLDKVFDEVFKGEPRLRPSRSKHGKIEPEKEKAGFAPDVTGTKEEPSQPKMTKLQRVKRERAEEDAARLKAMSLAERKKVGLLFQSCKTDRELWETLHREVFDQVRKLNLDGAIMAAQQRASTPHNPHKKNKAQQNDPIKLRILFQNYPHYLNTAVSTLRTSFPSSPLVLSILPVMTAIGRASKALGATTTLYKHCLRTAWLQQSNYAYIDNILRDMHSYAIEFDTETLALLDAIIKEHMMARAGNLGQEMQMVNSMELHLEGIQKIKDWRAIIAAQLGVTKPQPRIQDRPARSPHHDRQAADPAPQPEPKDKTPDALEQESPRDTKHVSDLMTELAAEMQSDVPKGRPAHVVAAELAEVDLLADELGLEPDFERVERERQAAEERERERVEEEIEGEKEKERLKEGEGRIML
ncbi:hypothetical protein IQ07DRAFT_586330 [Pyrenochaeta sp. DS3sAY3a]|nr:hypothetical protein IQ07DRAFT_586330 [Pyrenochaeta sp. DS3sAY3a]